LQKGNMMGAKPRSSLWFSLATDPCTVDLLAGTTQVASLRRLAGVAWGPIRRKQSNRVKTTAAYMTKTMHF